ncbi:MAG: hypothetical protein KGJ84_10200 [Elusimicrobia bacterium]|nr:hypothetical protein [Elusimicrobiota bacterium]
MIFHLDSGSKSVLSKTIANLSNMFKDPRLEGRLRAELVVNGMGYRIYEKGNGFGADLEALAARGVIFARFIRSSASFPRR